MGTSRVTQACIAQTNPRYPPLAAHPLTLTATPYFPANGYPRRYNVCIFAYGQTGSGKTFTMEGPDADPGVNTRALTDMFREAAARSADVEYT